VKPVVLSHRGSQAKFIRWPIRHMPADADRAGGQDVPIVLSVAPRLLRAAPWPGDDRFRRHQQGRWSITMSRLKCSRPAGMRSSRAAGLPRSWPSSERTPPARRFRDPARASAALIVPGRLLACCGKAKPDSIAPSPALKGGPAPALGRRVGSASTG
jgi:hypothetical protein